MSQRVVCSTCQKAFLSSTARVPGHNCAGKVLPKIHAGSPVETNASINRTRAQIANNGGMSAQQIAAHWPEVFVCGDDGKLSQIYDYELADGSGRFETNRLITLDSVADAIRKYGRKVGRA